AASGWHTAAISMRLLVDSELRIAGGLLGTGGEIGWPRPTRPGDELRIECEVLEIRPSTSKPDRGIVTMRMQTMNQHDEAVQIAVMKMLVPR
ncbi:MAG: dehydratase, partial [Woeseiaceae bacterium]